MERIHATTVAWDGAAVLLAGPAGAGKSDLALRLIDRGWELIADDYTELFVEGGRLFARPPETIQGLIEARGLGILRLGCRPRGEIRARFDLVAREDVPRLPETTHTTILDVAVPTYRLHAFDASAPAKVRLALRAQRENLFHAPETVS